VPNSSRPRRPARPGVWVGAVTLVLFVFSATLAQPAVLTDAGPGAYLPADGFRVRFTSEAETRSSEWAVDDALTLMQAGPLHFSTSLSLGKVDWANAQAARLSTVVTNTAGQATGRADDFFTVSRSEVRSTVEMDGAGGARIFSPGLPVLTSTMAAGRSWTADGTVWELPASGKDVTSSYHAVFTASGPTTREALTRRCLVVSLRLTIDGKDDRPTSKTWCPGLGIVAFSSAAGSWQASDTATPVAIPPATEFAWADAERLRFTPHVLNQTGPGILQVSALNPPAAFPDGTAVLVQGLWGDVLGLNLTAEPVQSTWRARPGSHSTASAVFEDRVLVANLNRGLVAYDNSGRWLWQSSLRDIATVAPVRLGNNAVVATLDGSVTAYDLASGAEVWSHRPGSEVRVPLAVKGDHVVVADQVGTLACFDRNGVQLWASTIAPPSAYTISTGTDPVVVTREAGSRWMNGFSLTDGRLLWRMRDSSSAKQLFSVDGQVIARGDTVTTSLNPATGATNWVWAQGRTHAGLGGGKRVLLLQSDELILLDETGGELTRWPVSLGSLESTAYLSANRNGVLVYGPQGISLGVVS
jgi:hypothetical protein